MFASFIDTLSILDGILAIQDRMYSQCNTPGGLGHNRIDHCWTKYGTVRTYFFWFKTVSGRRILHTHIIACFLLYSQNCSISTSNYQWKADQNALVLSAVNGAGLTIAVGCVISALCIGLVAAFGIAILHTFERFGPAQRIVSTVPKLIMQQICLDTTSIFPTRPHRLCWPQFQHLIAIHRSIRHNHG